jgi:uncharacterized membrane protein (TIGR02234 family)
VTPARRLAVTVLSLGVAALLLWCASRAQWMHAEFASPLRGTVRLSASGAQVHAELSAVALLLVAIVAALVASSGWVRRIVGVLTGAVALWLLWLGLDWFVGSAPVWPADAPAPPAESVAAGITVASIGAALVVVAGGLAVVAAVLMIGWSRAMPAMGRRYAASAPVVREDDWWNALDMGNDPTTGGRGTDPGPSR